MSCSLCKGYDSDKCPSCSNDLDTIACPTCLGSGEADWKVFDVIERRIVSCSEVAYIYAAVDEDDAYYLGQRFCKLSCECQTCKGKGDVYTDKYDNIYPII